MNYLWLGVIPLLASCASQPIALAPVGPRPVAGEELLAPSGNGQLQVFTETDETEYDRDVPYYPHRDYQIYTAQGKRLRRVWNSQDREDETPAVVTLPAWQLRDQSGCRILRAGYRAGGDPAEPDHSGHFAARLETGQHGRQRRSRADSGFTRLSRGLEGRVAAAKMNVQFPCAPSLALRPTRVTRPEIRPSRSIPTAWRRRRNPSPWLAISITGIPRRTRWSSVWTAGGFSKCPCRMVTTSTGSWSMANQCWTRAPQGLLSMSFRKRFHCWL